MSVSGEDYIRRLLNRRKENKSPDLLKNQQRRLSILNAIKNANQATSANAPESVLAKKPATLSSQDSANKSEPLRIEDSSSDGGVSVNPAATLPVQESSVRTPTAPQIIDSLSIRRNPVVKSATLPDQDSLTDRKAPLKEPPTLRIKDSPKKFVSTVRCFVKNYESLAKPIPKRMSEDAGKSQPSDEGSKATFSDETLDSFHIDAYSAEYELTDDDMRIDSEDFETFAEMRISERTRNHMSYDYGFKSTDPAFVSKTTLEIGHKNLPDPEPESLARIYPDISQEIETIEEDTNNLTKKNANRSSVKRSISKLKQMFTTLDTIESANSSTEVDQNSKVDVSQTKPTAPDIGFMKIEADLSTKIESSNNNDESLNLRNTLNRTMTVCRSLSQKLKKKLRRNNSSCLNKSPDPKRISQIDRDPELQEKLKKLLSQVEAQQNVITQINKALTACDKMKEFSCGEEKVESERFLLLAMLRKQLFLDEIRKLMKGNHEERRTFAQRAEINISNVSIKLKEDLIQMEDPGNIQEWIVIMVKQGLDVWSSRAVLVPRDKPVIDFSPKNLFTLPDQTPDFEIELEIYSLKLERTIYKHEDKYRTKTSEKIAVWKKIPSKIKRKKKNKVLKQTDIQTLSMKESSFLHCGRIELALEDVERAPTRCLDLVPKNSVLKGTIDLNLDCKLCLTETASGFVNFGEDSGGYAAWNHRWCVLEGRYIYFWNYPEDQEVRKPIHTLDLKFCTSRKISQVNNILCARPRTLNIEIARSRSTRDRNSTLIECKSTCTIIRNLLTFGTQQEFAEWEVKLNHIVTALREWRINDPKLGQETSEL